MDINDYLIPATTAKRFKNLYYIRYEKEYTGGINGERENRYTLELCKKKAGDELIGELWHRSNLWDCWIVKSECKVQDYWPKRPIENTFESISDKEEVKRLLQLALTNIAQ